MTFAVGIHQFLDIDMEIPLKKSHNNLKWRSFCYVSTILLKTFRVQYITSQARSKDWLSECLRASFPIFPLSARWSLAFLANNNILVNVVFSVKQEFIVLLFNHINKLMFRIEQGLLRLLRTKPHTGNISQLYATRGIICTFSIQPFQCPGSTAGGVW